MYLRIVCAEYPRYLAASGIVKILPRFFSKAIIIVYSVARLDTICNASTLQNIFPEFSPPALASVSEGDYTKKCLADALGCEYERLPAGGPLAGSELAKRRWSKQMTLSELNPPKLVVTRRSGRICTLTGDTLARFVQRHKTLAMEHSREYGWSTVEPTRTVLCAFVPASQTATTD